MKPIKFFNFALPFETYQELRTIAIKKEVSIAELVRQGIEYLLKDTGKIKAGQNEKN